MRSGMSLKDKVRARWSLKVWMETRFGGIGPPEVSVGTKEYHSNIKFEHIWGY